MAERYTRMTQNHLSIGRVGSIPTTGTTILYKTKPIIWNREKLSYLSKISISKTVSRCVVISSYSNHWENILGWKADDGSKFQQNARVPNWIWCQDRYIKSCLAGLIETDGCIYYDRGYAMVMFTNTVSDLAHDVMKMMK